MCQYYETMSYSKFYVVRILVRTKCNSVLNETFNIGINNEVFRVKIIEDCQGPMRIVLPKGLVEDANNRLVEDSTNSES